MPERSREPSPAAVDANRRGVLLRAQGRLAQAVDAFREANAQHPGSAVLCANLATALAETGELDAARNEYERALSFDENCIAALNGLGSLHVRAGRFAEARSCHERALLVDGENIAAHQAMFELEQIEGNLPKALLHQRRMLEQKTLFSQTAPHEARRLLALVAPGDWQANVPVDFLIDSATTTLHKLYVVSPEQIASAALPQADAVFVAIGESEETAQALALAQTLLRRAALPYINDPSKIVATNRVRAARALAQIRNVNAPLVARVKRSGFESSAAPTRFPLLIRPVGSQAGRGLALARDAGELAAYLNGAREDTFYVTPFVDFRSADGYYRKYRIVIVDGVPYPYHLAISPHWMIHYYNAPMRETPWMREEEARFLDHFEDVFGASLQQALRDVARAVGLEYFGVDCSVDAQGRLLIFEVDPAMIVHAGDDPGMFAYKTAHVKRIFDAFQKLIDRVGSR